MNWLDLGILIFFILAGFRGYARGLWSGLSKVVALALGIWGAAKQYPFVRYLLEENFQLTLAMENWLGKYWFRENPLLPERLNGLSAEALATTLVDGLAFFLLALTIMVLARVAFTFLESLWSEGIFGELNRFAGALLYLVFFLGISVLFFGLMVPIWPLLLLNLTSDQGFWQGLSLALTNSALVPLFTQAFAHLNQFISGPGAHILPELLEHIKP